MKPEIPWVFRYMGNDANKTIRNTFLVEVLPDEVEKMSNYPYPSLFTGKVISSKFENKFVGDICDRLINPFQDMAYYGSSCFQRVHDPREK